MRDFTQGNIAYHDQLCPAAWRGSRLDPEVRATLLEIALIFTHYLEIPDFKVIDVVLTGSMANYNWTKYSDFDVHVVTRYRDLECDDLAEAFYRAKKQIWNDQHDITVHGHEAELYVEDVEEPPVSAGMYSLIRGQWIDLPGFEPPEIHRGAVNAKVQDLIKQITSAVSDADSSEDLGRIKTKLRNMRRAGLDTGGEFSVENLAFKVLRNMGYIEELHQAYLSRQDRELSL